MCVDIVEDDPRKIELRHSSFVSSKIQKLFKISYHIEFCDTYIKH